MDHVFVEIFTDAGGMRQVADMLEWSRENVPFLACMKPDARIPKHWRRGPVFTGRRFHHHIMFNIDLESQQRIAPFVMKFRERDFLLWKLRWLPRPLRRGFFCIVDGQAGLRRHSA